MNLAIKTEDQEVKEYRVSEISALIKKTIDDNFGFIKIRGEISGLKMAPSGHAYFNLKDEDSIIACTCWKPIISRIQFKIEDGLEVIVSGRLTTYPGQSKYQMSAERIEVEGAGALMELLRKRKEALAKEGLFDQSRKKKIPFFPNKIGIITSPVGAVIQDIIHRVKDRCPSHLILWPVAVQGESCAFEVSTAINGFNQLPIETRPDVIIVARGGGSIEDLWGFNEEIVVRASANSEIPIISAIGHETDFTLIDFASSLRAPTPTAAAEFAIPVLSDLTNRLAEIGLRLRMNLSNYFNLLKHKLDFLSKSLTMPEKMFYPKQQKLDELSFKLLSSLPNNLKLKMNSLNAIKLPLNALKALIIRKEENLKRVFEKVNILVQKKLDRLDSKLDMNSKLLESLSIKSILKRGFAIIKSEDGRLLSSKTSVASDQEVTIEWHDGKANASIKDA